MQNYHQIQIKIWNNRVGGYPYFSSKASYSQAEHFLFNSVKQRSANKKSVLYRAGKTALYKTLFSFVTQLLTAENQPFSSLTKAFISSKFILLSNIFLTMAEPTIQPSATLSNLATSS